MCEKKIEVFHGIIYNIIEGLDMSRYQIINSNASDNNSILEYKKKMIIRSIKELKKIELEIAELEAAK